MSLLHAATFERLLPNYEQAFGELPPFKSATVEETVSHMLARLRHISHSTIGQTVSGEISAGRVIPDSPIDTIPAGEWRNRDMT